MFFGSLLLSLSSALLVFVRCCYYLFGRHRIYVLVLSFAFLVGMLSVAVVDVIFVYVVCIVLHCCFVAVSFCHLLSRAVYLFCIHLANFMCL